jgi:tetratricopeptide (TPR) repeat protein
MWDIFRSIGVIDNLKRKGSIKHYEEKLHEYQENEAEVLIDMGLLYYNDEKYEISLDHLKKAARIYSSLYEIESEAFVEDIIGDVYLSMRNMDKALEKYQKAFQLYSAARSSMKDDLREKIKEVNDIKEAIELASEDKIKTEVEKEYLDISEETNDAVEETEDTEDYDGEETTISCYLSYEKISPKLEKIMKIIKKEYNIKEPNNAEYETGYFQKSIFEADKAEEYKKEVALLQVLGNFLMKEEKPYSAMQNLKTAFNLSHENEDKEGEAFSLLLLGVVYCLLGKESRIYNVFKKSLNIFKEIKCKKGENIALDIINTLYNEDECSSSESTFTA